MSETEFLRLVSPDVREAAERTSRVIGAAAAHLIGGFLLSDRVQLVGVSNPRPGIVRSSYVGLPLPHSENDTGQSVMEDLPIAPVSRLLLHRDEGAPSGTEPGSIAGAIAIRLRTAEGQSEYEMGLNTDQGVLAPTATYVGERGQRIQETTYHPLASLAESAYYQFHVDDSHAGDLLVAASRVGVVVTGSLIKDSAHIYGIDIAESITNTLHVVRAELDQHIQDQHWAITALAMVFPPAAS